MKGKCKMPEIYLDNSATTKVHPKAAEAAFNVMTEAYGNPSSIHEKGSTAAKLMLKARNDIIASFFGQSALKKLPKLPGFLGGEEYGRLIFTSCGTESNNLAISSVIESCKIASPRIITSDSEHPAVLRCYEKWAEKGCDVVYLSTKNGVIDENELKNAVNKNTVLVSIIFIRIVNKNKNTLVVIFLRRKLYKQMYFSSIACGIIYSKVAFSHNLIANSAFTRIDIIAIGTPLVMIYKIAATFFYYRNKNYCS